MRSLVPDKRYFGFLNNQNEEVLRHAELAAACLMCEFPHLRAEEAKAVLQDWRLTRRTSRICEAGVAKEEKLAAS